MTLLISLTRFNNKWTLFFFWLFFTNVNGSDEICDLSVNPCSIDGCDKLVKMNVSLPIRQETKTGYDRYYFLRDTGGHWGDRGMDCRDTRAEVLEATSLVPVVFSKSACVVKLGLWYDPYSDSTFEFAHDLDIDHFIPLKEAYESGADKWSAAERSDFANEYLKSANLIPVWSSLNRSKGAREPHEWLPPNIEYACDYLSRWAYIKWFSGLSVDKNECGFIKARLTECH